MYIVENGIVLFVWIGAQVSDEWAKAVFGARTVAHIDTEQCTIPWKDTKESNVLRKLIDYVHRGRSRRMKVHRINSAYYSDYMPFLDCVDTTGRQTGVVVPQIPDGGQVICVEQSQLR